MVGSMTDIDLFDNYYEDLGIFLYMLPILSAFWAAFALGANKSRTQSQLYLAVCMIVIGIGMAFSFTYDRYMAADHGEIFRSINMIMTILGVVFAMFYFVSLMQPQKLTRWYIGKYLFVAFLFSLGIILSEVFLGELKPVTGWHEIRDNLTSSTVIFRLTASFFLLLFELYAVITVILMYIKHRRYINESYSYGEDIDLRWILRSMLLFVVFAISDLAWVINSSLEIKAISTSIMCVLICRIFWLGFRQGDVPLPIVEVESELNTDEVTEKEENKEDTCFINEEVRKDIKANLLRYIEKDKAFLNPNLSLSDVATALNTNRTYLSHLINYEFNVNFYTFINSYRVDYALAQILLQPDKMTVESLVVSSGFKSRSVFYRLFKSKTGLSPQDYILQARSRVSELEYRS